MSRQRCALEYACAASPTRSATNAAAIWAKPLFSAPMRLATGTRTSVYDNSAVSDERQPILSSLRLTANPGVPAGTGVGRQVPDVGAAVGFGDRQCADLLPAQRGSHELVDQSGVAGGDHVRYRDATGEQRREHAAGASGVVHLFADDHRVDAASAAAADGLGQAGAEKPGVAGAAVQVAGQLADPLPLVDVRQHLAFREGPHGLSQLVALGRGPPAHAETNSSGVSLYRLRNHSPVRFA